MGDEQDRRAGRRRDFAAFRPAIPGASSRRARRTARPSSARRAPGRGSARSAGAAACRPTFARDICRREGQADLGEQALRCARRAPRAAFPPPPARARHCRRRCATAAAPCRNPGRRSRRRGAGRGSARRRRRPRRASARAGRSATRKRRRLAAAGRADEADDFAALDFEDRVCSRILRSEKARSTLEKRISARRRARTSSFTRRSLAFRDRPAPASRRDGRRASPRPPRSRRVDDEIGETSDGCRRNRRDLRTCAS